MTQWSKAESTGRGQYQNKGMSTTQFSVNSHLLHMCNYPWNNDKDQEKIRGVCSSYYAHASFDTNTVLQFCVAVPYPREGNGEPLAGEG